MGDQRADIDTWGNPMALAIGRELLESEEPLTSSQLADALGKDPSNTKRVADRLCKYGALVHKDPENVSNGHRGRRPTAAYALATGQKELLRSALASAEPVGQLERGQALLMVEAPGANLAEIQAVLAEASELEDASWAATCDGERSVMLIAFEESVGALGASVDLMSQLSAAQIGVERITPIDLLSASEFRERLGRQVSRAGRVRTGRDTRNRRT